MWLITNKIRQYFFEKIFDVKNKSICKKEKNICKVFIYMKLMNTDLFDESVKFI